MNWRIGVIRLWVVFSIGWVFLCGLVLGIDEFKGLWKPASKYEISYNGKAVATVDGSLPLEIMRQEIINEVLNAMDRKILLANDPEAKKEINEASATADEWIKKIQEDKEAESARLVGAVKFLFVPPISLLIFGFLIGWALRGFRETVS